jgi:hypothetical protein
VAAQQKREFRLRPPLPQEFFLPQNISEPWPLVEWNLELQQTMKKVIFNNKVFYWLLIGYIALLLVSNLFFALGVAIIYAVIPLAIQCTLLISIFTRYRYLKIIIFVWAIVFLIIASSLQLIGNLLTETANGFKTFDLNHSLLNLVNIVIGILIIEYTRRTVTIVEV